MFEEFRDSFTERLVELRMTKGASAREMSLSLGQSEGYIAQIERKHNLPSMTVFSYICEYLGVTPKDYFDYEQGHPALLQEMIKKIKSFNEDELESVMSLVDIIMKKKT